jgi:nitrite reductase (NADH) small subunit
MSTAVQRAAGNVADIPLGEGRVVRVGDRDVAVFRLRDGSLRATQPLCPHLGGPLADGLIGNGTLVCPLHGRTFDLDTGAAAPGEDGVTTYPVRVDEAGTILITVPY